MRGYDRHSVMIWRAQIDVFVQEVARHRKMNSHPPRIIDSSKLLEYAFNDADVLFTDNICLFIGSSTDGDHERLGEVPCLAIVAPYYKKDEYLLVFCDEAWRVKGVIAFESFDEAKLKAERGYVGISKKWKKSPYSQEEVHEFLRMEYDVDPTSEWWRSRCSFCDRDDTEFENLVSGKYASICDRCVSDIYCGFIKDGSLKVR